MTDLAERLYPPTPPAPVVRAPEGATLAERLYPPAAAAPAAPAAPVKRSEPDTRSLAERLYGSHAQPDGAVDDDDDDDEPQPAPQHPAEQSAIDLLRIEAMAAPNIKADLAAAKAHLQRHPELRHLANDPHTGNSLRTIRFLAERHRQERAGGR